MTVDEFVGAFPEYAKIDRTLIASKLAEASRLVHAATWGKFAEDGVGNYTAHLIYMSPLGQPSKMKDRGESPYLQTFKRLRRLVVPAPRVV